MYIYIYIYSCIIQDHGHKKQQQISSSWLSSWLTQKSLGRSSFSVEVHGRGSRKWRWAAEITAWRHWVCLKSGYLQKQRAIWIGVMIIDQWILGCYFRTNLCPWGFIFLKLLLDLLRDAPHQQNSWDFKWGSSVQVGIFEVSPSAWAFLPVLWQSNVSKHGLMHPQFVDHIVISDCRASWNYISHRPIIAAIHQKDQIRIMSLAMCGTWFGVWDEKKMLWVARKKLHHRF